jgi:hypothetical protein
MSKKASHVGGQREGLRSTINNGDGSVTEFGVEGEGEVRMEEENEEESSGEEEGFEFEEDNFKIQIGLE